MKTKTYKQSNLIVDYSAKENKRMVQELIFSTVENKSIVSLLGPDVRYIDFLKQNGFTKMKFYESNPVVFLHQIQNADFNSNIKIIYGNINEHLTDDAFYDLDFCSSVLVIEKYLEQISKIKQFSLTIALRPAGTQKTLQILKKYIKKFEVFFYQDKGSIPMLTILKV